MNYKSKFAAQRFADMSPVDIPEYLKFWFYMYSIDGMYSTIVFWDSIPTRNKKCFILIQPSGVWIFGSPPQYMKHVKIFPMN